MRARDEKMEITLEIDDKNNQDCDTSTESMVQQNDKLKIVFKLACGLCSRLRKGLKKYDKNEKRCQQKGVKSVQTDDSTKLFLKGSKKEKKIERMNAGCVLIERSGCTAETSTPTKTSLAITIRKNTVPTPEEQCVGEEINEYLKRRRNAVFVMTEEERTGLKLVLKHYLQSQNIRQYII